MASQPVTALGSEVYYQYKYSVSVVSDWEAGTCRDVVKHV